MGRFRGTKVIYDELVALGTTGKHGAQIMAAYARGMRCPVLTLCMLLPDDKVLPIHVLCGAGIVRYQPTRALCAVWYCACKVLRYRYQPTRCPVLRQRYQSRRCAVLTEGMVLPGKHTEHSCRMFEKLVNSHPTSLVHTALCRYAI
eukprot:2006830-Rhodomonas_salina.2